MSEREDLLLSVADKIKTYRNQDLPAATPDHVDKWLNQFTPDNQLSFIREFDHLLEHCFITEEWITSFLDQLTNNQKIAGSNPSLYWKEANFLSIQQNGQSQKEMLKIFSGCLLKKYGYTVEQCGTNDGDFIYIDDIMFSGNRIKHDLETWIEKEAPQSAKLHIIIAAYHTYGKYYVSNYLDKLVSKTGKKIEFTFWRAGVFENRYAQRRQSEVLWPAVIPDDRNVKDYLELPSKFPFKPRAHMYKPVEIFSSEAARQIVESEFLIAGAKIIAMCDTHSPIIRPLGFSPFGVGFGSTVVTYRNCPNNCPLALWWGDPKATSGALNWYPLLPREGYSSARNVFGDIEF